PSSIIWKLSDLLYLTQNTTKHIEVISDRIHLMGDNLIILAVEFGDTC
ncbi:unnamed protein product, partial [marine sediment metagenome]